MKVKFVDEVKIRLCGGHGGRGCVSFQREKYRQWGGPDGGNGGQGGHVHICAHSSLATLGKLLNSASYCAQDGEPGRGRRQNGTNGASLKLRVPVGTEVWDENRTQVLADLYSADTSYLAVQGGRGGLGNSNFATARQQKPKYAQPGQPGQEVVLFLKLKFLADVGLVGLPNAGKSTLLAALSQKKPEIADYPFTTLSPNIGVVQGGGYRRLYLADIPGIIAGASRGAGLGLSFLKHIERVGVIVYLLDAALFDCENEVLLLQEELRSYNPLLLEKAKLIAINKCDLMDYDLHLTEETAARLRSLFAKDKLKGGRLPPEIIFISAKQKKGIDELVKKLFSLCPRQTQAERAL